MADQADRERESRESDITKFEEIRRDDEEERKHAAEEAASERLRAEQQPDQNEP